MQIIGHRGARGEAPENTLGGFAHLRQLGVRAVEFDVRQLADDQLVVIHDDNLLRTAGRDQVISAATLPQLADADQAWHFSADWPQEPVPQLEQVMSLLADFDHIEVEIKAVSDPVAADRLIRQLLPVLAPYQRHVTITSFDLQILQTLQGHDGYRRGLLVEWPLGQHAIDTALQLGCQRIGWKDMLVTEKLIRQSQQAGLKVSVWTVNDPARALQLQDWGIDGLITDVPQLMQRTLNVMD